MTKEDWATIEKKLSWPGDGAHLNCDGYQLGIYRARRTEMRDCLVIYVNGVFRGEWATKDCEERKRFLCPMKAYYYKPMMRAAIKANRAKRPKHIRDVVEKALGKLADPDASFIWYSCLWPSLKRLKAHLVKNNREISIIREKAEGKANGGNGKED
jgi:hypothetical protein